MTLAHPKIYNLIIQISIIMLGTILLWFAFVYYPRVVNDFKSGRIPTRPFAQPVAATSKNFPIQTSAYRIVLDENSYSYYVFVAGKNLEEYVFNRDSAKLTLKTALSVDDLCSFSVIYTSSQRLTIPDHFRNPPDC